MTPVRTTVVLMAYGSPKTRDEVEAYYTHIRRGRPPTPDALANLIARYERIGGVSPLQAITQQQAERLQERLRRYEPDLQVVVGMKHAPPFIQEVVAQAVQDGAHRLVALALAPHYSQMSIGAYLGAVTEVLRKLEARLEYFPVEFWHDHPLFLQAMAQRVREALAEFPEATRTHVQVLFTAHSLPERIRESGDPYPEQLAESSAVVARLAGIAGWHFAYQSAGHTGEPWLGPDVNDEVRRLAADGHAHLLVVPIGFVSDHLEILYDLDIELQETAAAAGVECRRTRLHNTDPRFIEVLAAMVRERLAMAPEGLPAHQVE